MDRLYPILWLRVIPWGNLALTQFECFINLSSSGICADDLISLQIRPNSCVVLVYRIKTKIYYDIQVSVLYGVGGCVKCGFFCDQIYSKILTSTSPIRLHWESIYTPVNDHRRAAAIWAIARRRWVKVLAADRFTHTSFARLSQSKTNFEPHAWFDFVCINTIEYIQQKLVCLSTFAAVRSMA